MAPLIADFYKKLSPSDAEWLAKTRKISVLGDAEVEEAWNAFDKAFDELAARFDILGEGNFRVVPGQITYSEMEMVSFINFVKRVSPEKGWKRVESRNGGRWSKLLVMYEEYLPKPVV